MCFCRYLLLPFLHLDHVYSLSMKSFKSWTTAFLYLFRPCKIAAQISKFVLLFLVGLGLHVGGTGVYKLGDCEVLQNWSPPKTDLRWKEPQLVTQSSQAQLAKLIKSQTITKAKVDRTSCCALMLLARAWIDDSVLQKMKVGHTFTTMLA